MRKPIILIDDDEELKRYVEVISKQNIDLEHQIKFLQKQANDLAKKTCDEVNAIWVKMKTRLKEINKMPKDFDEEKHNMFYHDGDRVIFYEGKDDPPARGNFMTVIKDLF